MGHHSQTHTLSRRRYPGSPGAWPSRWAQPGHTAPHLPEIRPAWIGTLQVRADPQFDEKLADIALVLYVDENARFSAHSHRADATALAWHPGRVSVADRASALPSPLQF